MTWTPSDTTDAIQSVVGLALPFANDGLLQFARGGSLMETVYQNCTTGRSNLFESHRQRRWLTVVSYRDLVAILGERGLSMSHSTILRWVVRYADACERRWSRFERPVEGSWRVDETFIKVRSQWMYLYRALDGQCNTVEFFLSRTRGSAAAKAFFRKALKHHREPHSITLDGHQPSHSAL